MSSMSVDPDVSASVAYDPLHPEPFGLAVGLFWLTLDPTLVHFLHSWLAQGFEDCQLLCAEDNVGTIEFTRGRWMAQSSVVSGIVRVGATRPTPCTLGWVVIHSHTVLATLDPRSKLVLGWTPGFMLETPGLGTQDYTPPVYAPHRGTASLTPAFLRLWRCLRRRVSRALLVGAGMGSVELRNDELWSRLKARNGLFTLRDPMTQHRVGWIVLINRRIIDVWTPESGALAARHFFRVDPFLWTPGDGLVPVPVTAPSSSSSSSSSTVLCV